MAKPNEKKNPALNSTIILIAAGVLLLALIVVSAFAYQWYTENVDLKKKNLTLRALTDDTTINSMNNEVLSLQQSLMQAQSEADELERKVQTYEAILNENGLLPVPEN